MSSVVWNGKWTNTLLDYMMDAGRGVFTVGGGDRSGGGMRSGVWKWDELFKS